MRWACVLEKGPLCIEFTRKHSSLGTLSSMSDKIRTRSRLGSRGLLGSDWLQRGRRGGNSVCLSPRGKAQYLIAQGMAQATAKGDILRRPKSQRIGAWDTR